MAAPHYPARRRDRVLGSRRVRARQCRVTWTAQVSPAMGMHGLWPAFNCTSFADPQTQSELDGLLGFHWESASRPRHAPWELGTVATEGRAIASALSRTNPTATRVSPVPLEVR